MSTSASSSSELRAVNARIATAYDVMPFDSEAIPGIDPVRVLGVGALYGAAPAGDSFDILDLGCGTGVQMARLGGLTKGRIVGADLSVSACAAARARCAAFGSRVEVICGDLLDLEPARLGQFDLIYNVGVLYVTPPEVQRHVLSLMASCLKPGGVALLSYYAGTAPLLMACSRSIGVSPSPRREWKIAAHRAANRCRRWP